MIELHIFLSTIALIVLCLAALQTLMIALQNHLLRHHQSSVLLKYLPPLEIMERNLFWCVITGFVLLTTVLITSIIFFHPFTVPALQKKFVLSLLAWCVFAVLIFGRLYRGWRGRVAMRWTLAGVLLLFIIYYGTGLLLNATH